MSEVLSRPAALSRARWLTGATIGWNTVEGIVAVTAGVAASSAGLIGFGLDSGIEVSAAVALAWRLARDSRPGCNRPDDRRATRLIALAFAALAAFVAWEAIADLVGRHTPDASPVGIGLAALSLLVMPLLARAKRRLAVPLGSTAVTADADQTDLCAALSAVLLVGLGANAVLGWWWADPVAALGVAGLAAVAAVRTWNAEDLADTCC